jgi:hypothetical protein
MLSHEKLDVYQRSIEFLACALKTAEKLPRGQVPRDRARFSHGCCAILDVARLLAAISEAEWDQAKSLLVRVVEMLSKTS